MKIIILKIVVSYVFSGESKSLTIITVLKDVFMNEILASTMFQMSTCCAVLQQFKMTPALITFLTSPVQFLPSLI